MGLESNTCEKNRGDRSTRQWEASYRSADPTKPLQAQDFKWLGRHSVTG